MACKASRPRFVAVAGRVRVPHLVQPREPPLSAILALFNFIRHIDKELVHMTQTMGPSLYLALFAIVFAETGLVVTPFLPGDSLLFAIGVLCAMDPVRLGLPADGFVPSLPVTMLVLFAAAVLGDGVNYHVGRFLGPKVFASEKSWLLNKKHLIKTQAFYEKYGNKAIILARFVPIVRTFAPFVAGIGQMQYRRFLLFNVIGAAIWVSLLVPLGYAFADSEIVKKRFELVILAIVFLSVLPMVIEIGREWLKPKTASPATDA
jgi:membrane-associated protein